MKRTIITGVLAGILGIGIGASTAPEPEPVVQPTPQVVTTTLPAPTPRVITETVTEEVTPAACYTAILAGYTVMEGHLLTLSDILSAYADYPDENLTDFGRRVEGIIADLDMDEATDAFDEWEDSAGECAPV